MINVLSKKGIVIVLISLGLLPNIKIQAQTLGCTDPLAINYNSAAFINNGSCRYDNASINVSASTQLPSQMKGTSGLIWMNNKLWTQNNFSDINLYSFDPGSVNNFQLLTLKGNINVDWEEMTQDNEYVYIGDFGNNANGNRKDLQILRVKKNTINTSSVYVDTIKFSYATQNDFTAKGTNKTNYDCEAFIVTKDSLYLFTKEWLSGKTSIYRLPKTPGSHVATFSAILDVQGFVTGAVLMEDKRLLVLCGYNNTLQPFLYLLYDYPEYRFFEGNKRKISVNLPFHQVEAITTKDGLNYHITNEAFVQSSLSVPQKLHELNLNSYLFRYLSTTNVSEHMQNKNFKVYPVPARANIHLDLEVSTRAVPYRILDNKGAVIQQGIWSKAYNNIDVSSLSPGTYWIILAAENKYIKRWVKE